MKQAPQSRRRILRSMAEKLTAPLAIRELY
jgi:hypothetical protein